MNKNLIFIVSINSETSQFPNSDYAQYSIKTWEYWCKKNFVDLKVLDENIGNFRYPIWNKELIYQFGEGYDKIGIVDSDTMIRWDAPNIFDFMEEDKFYGVNDLCDLNWLLDSIKQRQRFFPNIEMDIFKYINAGVLFFSSKYLDFFQKFLTFVTDNMSEIEQIKGGGKEQTLLNFFLQQEKVDLELLTPAWNLLSIHRKNMFSHNWQLNQNRTPYFVNYAFIWHMTGFPIEQRVQVMKSTWEFTKQNYQ